jgi:hypothetical protein
MDETKGHSLEVIEQRYLERQAQRTGRRWKLGGARFRMTRLRGSQK